MKAELTELSKEKLETCHEDLVTFIEACVDKVEFPFQVVKGGISLDQLKADIGKRKVRIHLDKFIDRKSKAKSVKYTDDLYNKHKFLIGSKNAHKVSRAVTIFAGNRDESLITVGQMIAISKELLSKKKIKSEIIWEGNKLGPISEGTGAICTFSV